MSTGKVIAIIFAVCAGLGVITIGSCAGLIYYGYKSADVSVSPRVDALFAAIEQGKFLDTYDTDLSTEFQAVTSKDEYATFGKLIAARLGTLKSKSLHSFNMRQFNLDSRIDATYQGEFEKGAGTIVVSLKKEGGDWKFLSFRVNSPLFESEVASVKCPACGELNVAKARFCSSCGKPLPHEPDPAEAEPAATKAE